MLGFLVCRAVVTSKLGMVLIAIRDAEIAHAVSRLQSEILQTARVHAVRLHGRHRRSALRAAGRHIDPGEFAPGNSIEAVIWVAVGGRGTLAGAALGAVLVNYAKTYFTSGVLAPYWLFMLGSLFIGVTLLLPRGIVGTMHHWTALRRAKVSAAAEDVV